MKLFALTLALALTACGGGGGADPPTIRITSDSTGVGVDGDALVAGACLPTGCVIVPKPWPSYVSIPGYKTVNASVGSMSMREVINGWPLTGVKPWAQKVAEGAGVEVLGLGINDGNSLSPAEFAAYLRQAVFAGRAAGKFMVLATPSPTGFAKVDALAQVTRDVASEAGAPLIDIDRHLRTRYADLSFAADLVHPNQAAYTLIGEFVQKRLMEILK